MRFVQTLSNSRACLEIAAVCQQAGTECGASRTKSRQGKELGHPGCTSPQRVCCLQEEKQKALKEKLAKGQQEGDLDVAPVWSGAGVGQIHSIDSAEEVVKSVWDAACARMREISGKNVPFRMLHPGGGLRL